MLDNEIMQQMRNDERILIQVRTLVRNFDDNSIRVVKMKLHSTEKILFIKLMVELSEGIPRENQLLFFGRQLQNDEKTLKELNITKLKQPVTFQLLTEFTFPMY